MVLNHKPTGRAISMPAGLVYGNTVSLGLTLGLSAVIAKMVETGYMQENQIGYGILCMLMAASFLGAMVASAKIKRQRLMVCMLSGVLYFCVLLSITALFFGGQYEAVGVTGILVMGGSTLAMIAGGQGKMVGKRKKIRMKNR